jgi:ribosomal-protein-alanine N-acetyltransferase
MKQDITYKLLDIEDVKENKVQISEFLHTHLDRFRDDMDSIKKCLDYIINDPRSGKVFTAYAQDQLCGLTAILHTGMHGFAPENFLVYIAVNSDYRGNGIGKKLIHMAKEKLSGGICLHVEPDNPAKRLYEREDFTNKYLEMRYQP